MDEPVEKSDPIRERYYRPLEIAERWSDVFFYVSAGLSLLALLVDRTKLPTAYDIIHSLFVLSVAAVFILGWAIRFYFTPRAQAKRYQDFLSHAYGVSLTDGQTSGYYNPGVEEPGKRLAAQLLENTLYSTDTIQQMARIERIKVVIYAVVLAWVLLNRSTDLSIIAVIAQIIFSEQILSKWLRIEWARKEFEGVYEALYRLIQSKPEPMPFSAMSQELLGRYETAKANACVTLSHTIFSKRRPRNMAEWQRIRMTLGL